MITQEQKQQLLERGIAGFVILFLAVGALLLSRYESARGRDIEQMAQLLMVQSSLSAHAVKHGVYPVVKSEGIVIGDRNAQCLSSVGFTTKDSPDCAKGFFTYLFPIKGADGSFASYRSLYGDRSTACLAPSGCAWYEIQTRFETNAVMPKGLNTLTP